MTMPLLNNRCHCAGLMYTEPTGGNNGCTKKYSGIGGSTVTVKLHCALWPQASLATQVTVVIPTGKVLPLGGLQLTDGMLHPPPAELVYVTVAPLELVAVTVI